MRCAAILVIYNPEVSRLKLAIASLLKNGLSIILVDNSETAHPHFNDIAHITSIPGVTYLPLKFNSGIANAQNEGIKLAIKNNYEYILLSDQDTIYPDNFLQSISNEFHALSTVNKKIAAIGPAYLDKNKPDLAPSFEKYHKGSVKKIYKESGAVEVSQLIASGMFIPVQAIQHIGLMDSKLFIDWVDLEWCWRAINAGYTVYGTFNIKIDHQLGDSSIKIFGKSVTIHSPFRNYFIIRNGLHLAIRGILLDSSKHRWYLFKRVIRYFIGMSLLSDNRLADIRMMLRGFSDGIRGKLGPLQ